MRSFDLPEQQARPDALQFSPDNRYLAITGNRGFFPEDAYGQADGGPPGTQLTLHLDGFENPVSTDIAPKGFFRNRSAWAP